ncbi:type VII secretion target [Mycobacterium hubeiense]|uniref:type VII secretion target n=1 Tax=Mycobacterium hubeiense TaxID=1867256 RepID=UPI000C7EC7DE|nr:type VII secretion target [Mycobacterium sp. QGD 101]
MSEQLKVDPSVLQTVGASFGEAGAGIAGIGADAPLGDAAGAVPQLATASACQLAASAVASETTAIADGARTYGGNLNSAAGQYQGKDETAADAIKHTVPR